MTPSAPPRSDTPLTALELALGMVLGTGPGRALPAPGGRDPLAAIEAAVLPALRRAPCLVSFSGGRDSSAVLAVAVRVARREGLPDPIPATIRPIDAPAADERRWQELVVAHLGVRDWLRIEVGDELDAVGPVARRVQHRHGLLWPFNAHFHVPMLEAARGGALLTGIGGDELFRAATSRRAAAVVSRRVSPTPRDLRRIALHAAPEPLRRRWHARGEGPDHPWLTPAARDAARKALARWSAAEPRGLRARLAHVRRARYLGVGTASLALLAKSAGAAIAHPLLHYDVWAAVADSAPRGGHLGRDVGMAAVFGALLPAELHSRADKAAFDEVFFHEHSRELARGWGGAGVPAATVDPSALRAHWLGDAPRGQSFTLLQAAWLASGRDRAEQSPAGLGEGLPAARAAQAPYGQ